MGGGRVELLAPYMDAMLAFVGLVASDGMDRSESLLRATIGLLGDMASAFPAGPVLVKLQQPWVLDYIKLGRSRGNSSETRKTANWAREVLKASAGSMGAPVL